MNVERILSVNYGSATCHCIYYVVKHWWNWETNWDPSISSNIKLWRHFKAILPWLNSFERDSNWCREMSLSRYLSISSSKIFFEKPIHTTTSNFEPWLCLLLQWNTSSLKSATAPGSKIVSPRDGTTIGGFLVTVAKVSPSGEHGRWLPVVTRKPIPRGPASIDFALRAFVTRVRNHAAVVGVDSCVDVAAAGASTGVTQTAGLPSADGNFAISAASLKCWRQGSQTKGCEEDFWGVHDDDGDSKKLEHVESSSLLVSLSKGSHGIYLTDSMRAIYGFG